MSKPTSPATAARQDAAFALLVKAATLFTLVLFSGIIVFLIKDAMPTLDKYGLSFLWQKTWSPSRETFGALVPIYGTLVTSFIALLIAVPISFGIAFFLTEISPPWLRRPLGTAIELLAGIPSIVYGMWGFFVFCPFFAEFFQISVGDLLGDLPIVGVLFSGPRFGIGLLAAGIVLAIMIIPYIASVMRDVFEQTPALMKESAYGIGCTKWEVMWKIILPFTKSGVVGGIMLGLGRALGETMAITFVIGNSYRLTSASLFTPSSTITSAIANEFAEADSALHISALMELGLILFLITFVVLVLSKLLVRAIAKKEGTK